MIHRGDAVCVLTLNRPEKRNSLSPDLLIDLYQVIEGLSKDDSVRTLILRGAGEQAFSAGYDVGSLPTKLRPDIQEKLRRQNPLELATESLASFPYPVIAMLNGSAYGAGCELAICCDIRIAADDVRMGIPAAKIGLVYPLKGLHRFIQVLGVRRAKELLFTGRAYEGSQLKEMGLVDHLVPRPDLEPFTFRMAEEMAHNAPLALKGTKRILNLLANAASLGEDERQEAEAIIADTFNSEDLREGQRAFLEKREPRFKGK